ncbi:MAG: ATP-binding cassette domain-containing protein [Muribaculaceae bacterium]|nr:ATP-binding cassette domain-containing protein [Muribaculaceae bacterium]
MRRIELSEMLPAVFVNETIPHSEIWLTSCIFERGRHYLVEAPSGGGKSSLMAYLYGYRTDFRGCLRFNGRDTAGFPLETWQQLRRRHLAYLPQELDLFPELTCIENIRLKNDLTGHIPEARIFEWLERLGIESRRDSPVGRMSIGQQQRVAIIRSLCMPFDFLLLDEPVSHLDATNNRIAAEIIAEEATRQGAGVISTSVGNPLLLHSATNIRL